MVWLVQRLCAKPKSTVRCHYPLTLPGARRGGQTWRLIVIIVIRVYK
jgi:hypothetical protein